MKSSRLSQPCSSILNLRALRRIGCAAAVAAGAAGSGNGTVQYAVAANPTPSVRIGTITVGGQAHTVTQSAAAATWITPQQKLKVAGAAFTQALYKTKAAL